MGTPRNGPWLKVLLGGVAAGMVLLGVLAYAMTTTDQLRWVVNFVRHAMRPSELINPVAFVQMLPGRCTPVQLAAAACCKKFLYIQ